jgi:hypothetical protein
MIEINGNEPVVATRRMRQAMRAGALLVPLALVMMTQSGCVTTRIEEAVPTVTTTANLNAAGGMGDGEAVVLLTRRFNNQREAEEGFTNCVADAMTNGHPDMVLRSEQEFLDGLFPWFEPRYAPNSVDDLPDLLAQPGITERLEITGVRYIVWLDGQTRTVDGGGSITCEVGAGVGCLGFQWWENNSDYEASIWDLHTTSDAGLMTAQARGTSYLPAIVVPIPIIARTRVSACKGLADRLVEFLTAQT